MAREIIKDTKVQAKVAEAGELLIRAAAALGTLTGEEQAELAIATDGKLSDCIAFAIAGAAQVSPAVAESLRTHAPAGFNALAEHK